MRCFALLRAVEGNISNADGGIGFFNFRRADGVGGDVGPALDQRVDPFVDGGDGHDFDVIPSQAAVRERTEDVVPNGELRRIFAGDALAFNIADGFDRRIFLDDQTAAQRRAAHDQTGASDMRKWISSANFKLLPLVNHSHVNRVYNAEVQLAAIEERHKGAGAGVGLHLCLHLRRLADDFSQAAG